MVNENISKPGTEVKVGDIVEIRFGSGTLKFKVLKLVDNAGKDEASTLYEIME